MNTSRRGQLDPYQKMRTESYRSSSFPVYYAPLRPGALCFPETICEGVGER